MKKILCLIMIAISLNTFSQSLEIGIGYENFNIKGKHLITQDLSNITGLTTSSEEVKVNEGSIALSFGGNFPFAKIKNELSFGIYGGIIGHLYVYNQEDVQNYTGQTLSTGSSATVFGYQIPVYANFRAGGHATKDSESKFLFGLGGGLMLNGFNISTEIQEKGAYITPAVMAEAGWGSVKCRFDYTLTPFRSHYKSYTGDIPKYTIKNFAIHIIYIFNKG